VNPIGHSVHQFGVPFLNRLLLERRCNCGFRTFPPSYALYSTVRFSRNFRNCFVRLYNLRKIISLSSAVNSVCVCVCVVQPIFFLLFFVLVEHTVTSSKLGGCVVCTFPYPLCDWVYAGLQDIEPIHSYACHPRVQLNFHPCSYIILLWV
jgi:hypothetical protein